MELTPGMQVASAPHPGLTISQTTCTYQGLAMIKTGCSMEVTPGVQVASAPRPSLATIEIGCSMEPTWGAGGFCSPPKPSHDHKLLSSEPVALSAPELSPTSLPASSKPQQRESRHVTMGLKKKKCCKQSHAAPLSSAGSGVGTPLPASSKPQQRQSGLSITGLDSATIMSENIYVGKQLSVGPVSLAHANTYMKGATAVAEWTADNGTG
eukprot:1151575-Pelagomonas_calceolata.AAC.3